LQAPQHHLLVHELQQFVALALQAFERHVPSLTAFLWCFCCAVGVIGDICSRASVAAAGVANMRKIPIISPASTSPSLSETDFFFRTVRAALDLCMNKAV
jgi:hypothetical protein